MTKLSVTFIDPLGLKYHGDTLMERGLGGSESAVICMARELCKLGMDVTVFNNCEKEGYYDRVMYADIKSLEENNFYSTDVLIVSRTVEPFVQPQFDNLRKSAKLKILWMHDTFCGGDQMVEDLTVFGAIDEIFTLSDFHTSYVGNCWHGGNRRNFEVLRNKIWQTRNGINIYGTFDLSQKDPNAFVYNASVGKGMKPLLNNIWPQIKAGIPEAHLTVVGGYYKADKADGFEKDVIDLHEKHHGKNGVTFTGIIKQDQIADILKRVTFFIYPTTFPETFGISTLEGLAYGVVPITCNFGALGETALDLASYKMDYAIEPNNLFPNIDVPQQERKFIEMTHYAHANKYLTQQKQNYTQIVRDIATWDTVAVQWKQHFFRKLGLNLSVEETRKADRINQRVRDVFGRRFQNKEDSIPRHSKEKLITIITPCFNAEQFIGRCIESVASQDYDNYQHIIIDDCSTDDTYNAIFSTLHKLSNDVAEKFTVVSNKQNVGALKNQYDTLMKLAHSDGIVMLLDGDDWLVNDPHIFTKYNNMYEEDAKLGFTYGSCWSLVDNIPLIAQEYPQEVKEKGTYREHHFNWILPYTHLRTFKTDLIGRIDKNKLVDEYGNFYRAGGDGALFYALIEECGADAIKAVKDIVYNYNDTHPLNDYKIHGEEQTRNAARIARIYNKEIGKPEKSELVAMNKPKQKILIAIPTAKYIEPETFKAIYDLEIPEGFETTFQYFYGYNIDQVRNLIAHWIVDGNFDYLFSVDSDMSFPSDTLKRLLARNVDIVSGVYRQRKNDVVIELYGTNGNLDLQQLHSIPNDNGLAIVNGCGFGCCLVRRRVFEDIGYPYFEYHSSIDHRHTISEDVDFCGKAKAKGYATHADLTVLCRHHGSTVFELPPFIPHVVTPVEEKETDQQKILRDLRYATSIPVPHKEFLTKEKVVHKMMPRVIYDIGASVLHWTDFAKELWPNALYFAFEAAESCKFLYDEERIPNFIGVLGKGEEVTFYEYPPAPGGNSYYRENPIYSDKANEHYPIESGRKVFTQRLDDIVEKNNLPRPELIKIDVQGAELDVLKGAEQTLKSTRWLILELPNVEYNVGAPSAGEVILWLADRGFQCVRAKFCDNGHDADYFFANIMMAPNNQ